MGRWTASTTGSERKGFEFGMDSSTASAEEVKGSEWAEGEKRRRRKKEGTERLWWKGWVRKLKKCMQDDVQGENVSDAGEKN